MTQPFLPAGRAVRRIALLVAPVVLGVAALGLFFEESGKQGSELRAVGLAGSDSDGDGLCDTQEAILGTLLDQADSDLDGYSDLLEIAQQTDPLDDDYFPIAGSPRVGMTGFVAGGFLTMTTAILVPGGDLGAVDVTFGVALAGELFPIGQGPFFSITKVEILPSGPVDKIMVFQTGIPESWIHVLGGTSLWCRATQTALPTTAAVLGLLSLPGTNSAGDPIQVLVHPEPAPAWMFPPSTRASSSQTSGVGGVGTIFRPLVADENIPTDWTPGQICFQEMHPVGYSGVNVVYEVDAASCESFDTYCSPTNCFASVGQELEFVDPGAVIGG
ncbi:MAG: hypothetical protein ACI8QS_001816 [Planctomycetota bacterium]|jgi:hypothetical protein